MWVHECETSLLEGDRTTLPRYFMIRTWFMLRASCVLASFTCPCDFAFSCFLISESTCLWFEASFRGVLSHPHAISQVLGLVAQFTRECLRKTFAHFALTRIPHYLKLKRECISFSYSSLLEREMHLSRLSCSSPRWTVKLHLS